MSNNNLIEVTDFRKTFEGKVVHDNVSFSVKRGECLGLVGGSGAGKSVLLRSLIGLERPDRGSVVFDGQELTELREKEFVAIRKRIAYAFQGGALFDSMTVFDNIAYPLRAHMKISESEIREKVLEQLDDFDLMRAEKLFPAELSGGMQKRVGIARAVVMHPEVILYDEPTAGLDPANTKNIQSLILRSKQRGVTSILVTHDMPTAMAVCDRISLLRKGQIAASGTVKDLQKANDGPLIEFLRGDEL
jgi:phospholipid/cholesterol/gamma-HCH transport system ATP-binding protein